MFLIIPTRVILSLNTSKIYINYTINKPTLHNLSKYNISVNGIVVHIKSFILMESCITMNVSNKENR